MHIWNVFHLTMNPAVTVTTQQNGILRLALEMVDFKLMMVKQPTTGLTLPSVFGQQELPQHSAIPAICDMTAVMLSYLNGARIEYQEEWFDDDDCWELTEDPKWNWELFNYRVALDNSDK